MIRLFCSLLFSAFFPTATLAQEVAWIQIEAQSKLTRAQERAQDYSGNLQDVNGFDLGSGWYGIALGPYTPADAAALARQLRRDGLIPGDSFVAEGRNYRNQFWPVGVSVLGTANIVDPIAQEPEAAPEVAVSEPTIEPVIKPEPEPVVEVPQIQNPDETRQEARASEAELSREDKKDLQIALKWAGFYTAAIDGSYGRGTRGSMRTWQEANNHEPTGVLTTLQRVELLAAYNAVLEGVNLRPVRDGIVGIRMNVPLGIVAIDAYEPPFARYAPTSDVPAQLMMISQAGDQTTLFGLYEILQTLEVVPTEGPRNRTNSGFEIDGQNQEHHTYVTAELRNGEIKGFMLVWPSGDDERRTRILDDMKSSFERLEGVLDPAMGEPGEDQAIDLISGLDVRKPDLSRTGFYLDANGLVLTTSEAVGSCARITLDQDYDASIVYENADLGLAVLKPSAALAPEKSAVFQSRVPRLQSEVAVAGFPYQGILPVPALTFGKLADIRGLNGEEDLKRLALTAQAGDAGGPVFDTTGSVLGMLLPKGNSNGQTLPPQVSFVADSDAISAALTEAGITINTQEVATSMTPEMMTLAAQKMTVLVSCWGE